MKTAIFIESMSGRGGTEIVAANLCAALQRAGTVCVVLSKQLPANHMDNVCWLGADQSKKRLRSWLEQNGITAVINFSHENIPMLASPIPGVMRIAVFHWSVKGYEDSILDICRSRPWPFNRLAALKNLLKFRRIHKAMRRLGHCVALTEAGKMELDRLYDVESVVIPNFIPTTQTEFITSNLSNGTVVFVGRLSREKGVFHLLDIWERISKAVPELRLEIYGEGHERSEMERRIEKQRLSNIFFKGFEPDTTKIYRNADLLLCPSETEGFGMVLIEAMRQGVIPLAFDCPVSPGELIGDAGVIVPCFDIDYFANAAVELLSDRTRMKLLQDRCVARAGDFSESTVISKWKQLLEKNI